MRGSDERERAGFFVYPGVPALLRTAPQFFGGALLDLSVDYFYTCALKTFLRLCVDAAQGKKKHFGPEE